MPFKTSFCPRSNPAFTPFQPVLDPFPNPFLPLSTPVLAPFLYCLAIISGCALVAAQPLDHVGSSPVCRPVGGLYSWREDARDQFALYVCSHAWEQAEQRHQEGEGAGCVLRSHQVVQCGPRWTKERGAVTQNEITKLTTVQHLNVQRCSFAHYSPVVTPRTLPSAGRSTKRDTHHNTAPIAKKKRRLNVPDDSGGGAERARPNRNCQ